MFEMYHRLLALFEPHEAILWLIRPQPAFDNRSPCQVLTDPQGYQDVLALIDQLRAGKEA